MIDGSVCRVAMPAHRLDECTSQGSASSAKASSREAKTSPTAWMRVTGSSMALSLAGKRLPEHRGELTRAVPGTSAARRHCPTRSPVDHYRTAGAPDAGRSGRGQRVLLGVLVRVMSRCPVGAEAAAGVVRRRRPGTPPSPRPSRRGVARAAGGAPVPSSKGWWNANFVTDGLPALR